MIDETEKTIWLIWSAEDVLNCAYRMDRKLNLEEAWEILKYLYDNYDCNYGLTWQHLQDAIIEFTNMEQIK